MNDQIEEGANNREIDKTSGAVVPIPAIATDPITTTVIPFRKRRWVKWAAVGAVIMAVTGFMGVVFEIPNSVMSWFLNWRELSKTDAPQTNSVLASPIQPAWQPPELPANCTNVLMSFGGQTLNLPIMVARIGRTGTKLAVKDLPEFMFKDLENTPGYSPRNPNVWFKLHTMRMDFGGKPIDYPIAAFVVSNRLYVEAQVPITNERRMLFMRDDLDTELPRLWDRNYNSNSFEVVNEERRPVLQVKYKAANDVQVNGIFMVNDYEILESFGGPPLLITPLVTVIITNQQFTQQMTIKDFNAAFTNQFTIMIDSNAPYSIPFTDQKAIFKYPSNRHPGELAEGK
jgi:hypothetical protein